MPLMYEGRPLPRPGEEVVDQGFAFDLQTLLGRRQLLRAVGLGAVTLGLAACESGSTSRPTGAAGSTAAGSTAAGSTAAGSTAAGSIAAGEIPEETVGPYPGDGSNGPDLLERSGVIRSDIRSSFGDAGGTADGVPLTLELTVRDLANAGKAFAGTAVYVWQCDREGRYSMYSDGVTDENYLRGVQIADGSGVVRFTSIYPACYPGRWPHVHFEVYPDQASIADSAKAIATSQVALPESISNQVYAQGGYEGSAGRLAQLSLRTDMVFRDDGGASQLATVTGDVTSGFTAALTVGVDTTTKP